MSQHTRTVVLAIVAAVVVVAGLTTMRISDRQADDTIDGVRRRAASATVSPADVLGDLYSADGAIAHRLGVEASETAIETQGANHWCVTVTIRRLTAVRRAAYTVEPEGRLAPTDHC